MKRERAFIYLFFPFSFLLFYYKKQMSQDRQQYKVQHSLSRLALAKAIKTPEDGDLEAEPWNKSVIFNQPFISDLHKQKHQLLQHRRDKSSELKPQIQANRQYRKTVSRPSPSIGE
jgi:hypothetical protein